MRLPGTARLGIFALCVGILVFGPVYYWVNTRTLVPLDVPVTLAPGHIRTGDFKINVDAYFSIQIRFPYSGDSVCRYTDGLQTRRVTSIGGQAITVPGVGGATDVGVTQGTYLGSFRSKSGHYNLDIEVLSATRYFDRCQPRLLIEASPYDFNQWDSILSASFFFCVFCEFLGVVMLLVFATIHFRKGSLEELRLRIFNTDAPTAPVPPAKSKAELSFPLLSIFGILGVVTGIVLFAATKHWYDTRTFVVVDMPVSLGPGHIQTGNFTTQLKGTYGITFDTNVPYIDGCPLYLVLKTHWIVTREGRVAAHRDRGGYEWEEPDAPIEGANLGSFDAEPGTYNLDVAVLSDGRCLDIGKPHLRVFLSGGDRAEYDDLNARLQIISFVSVGIGVAFLCACRFVWLRKQPRALTLSTSVPERKPTWGITGLRYRPFPARTGWAMNPVKNLSTIARVCALIWFTAFVSIWIVYARSQRVSKGLLVSLPRKGVPTVTIVPGLTAPLIKIDAKRQLYLNYKQTTWEKLPGGLEQALRGLPVRVVYFDAENDALFMDAAQAIDIIQGSGAKVILMTPGSKSEN